MRTAVSIIGKFIIFTVIGIFKLLVFANSAFSAHMRRNEKRQRESEARVARFENEQLRRLRLDAARRSASRQRR